MQILNQLINMRPVLSADSLTSITSFISLYYIGKVEFDRIELLTKRSFMAKKAVIIGVSSQDGSYLADLLLEKGYEVTGTIRRSTNYLHPNLQHLYGHIKIEAADLIDEDSIARVIKTVQPDEVYNIAAQSVPADSWSHPIYTGEATALGAVRVFEAVRNFSPHAKVYQATSRVCQ